jgi:hypothetical protein
MADPVLEIGCAQTFFLERTSTYHIFLLFNLFIYVIVTFIEFFSTCMSHIRPISQKIYCKQFEDAEECVKNSKKFMR